MVNSLSWAEIDTNRGSSGYLDSLEVRNARKQGIDNVFVGMIQADYEGTIDADRIKDKYDKGAMGRIPVYGTEEDRKKLVNMYRELIVLQHKYQNAKEEFDKKYTLLDDLADFLSKIKILNKNKEYNSDKENLDKLSREVALKEKALQNFVSEAFYVPYKSKVNEKMDFTAIILPDYKYN